MTIEDAEKLGIDLYERRSYLRLENCKVNLSAAPLDGEWYRIVGQPLGNRTDKYPDGDVVGVPVRWKPQPIALAWSQVATALNVIDAGCEGGKEFYSSRPQASRKASEVIKSCCMRMTHAQAVAIMEEWLKLGVLVRDTYTSQNRHRTVRLKVDPQAKERLRQQIEGA